MRILILSDIHSNVTALECVLASAGKIDAVWCLGDLVGYGPDPNEVIQRVQALPGLICLLGNHDAATLGRIDLDTFNHDARQSIYWTRERLTPENRAFLETLPEKTTQDQVTLTHGSPRNPVWEYILDLGTASANFECFDTQLCFVGHSHLPIAFFPGGENGNSHAHNHVNGFAKLARWRMPHPGEPISLQERAILNPGSVGQPRDHDPRTSFAIYDPEVSVWEPFRVEYDYKAVQERIFQAGLPLHHAHRLAEGS